MEITTSITEVTVYPNGARVTRSGNVLLEAGTQTLEITGLPLKLEVDSVRVAARGGAGMRLLSTEVQRRFFSTTPTEHLRNLETQIEATQDALNALKARKQWLEVERTSLEATLKAGDRFAAALAFARLDPATHFERLQHFHQRAQELITVLVCAEKEERTLKRQLEKLTQEYRQYAETRPREQYSVLVTAELKAPGPVTLTLTYTITDASWTPLYDLRLLSNDQLEVAYLGQVEQRTGEAWENVPLTLSTARPVYDLTIPELQPWPLDEKKPQPRLLAAAPMRMAAAAMDGSAPEASFAAEEVTAEVTSEATVVTYRLPTPATIPPDGTLRKVTVARFELKPELSYVTVPKLELAVYRRAHLINRSPYTWLPGTANLFWEDTFLGRTQLKLLPPEGACELPLGLEDRIRVERKLTLYEVDKRLVGDRRRLRIGYEITLENLLDTPVTIEVRDQIPYARHEQIKVKLENASPPAQEREQGRLSWTIKLTPHSKSTVRFEFSVEHPTSLAVTGLE